VLLDALEVCGRRGALGKVAVQRGERMTADQFLDLLRRSLLVDEARLGDFLNFPNDADQLAAAMVAARVLTQWQADKLLEGNWKGFMVGQYKLLRHLRKDGTGQTYVAEHTLMKRKVAIKVLPPSRVGDLAFVERFRLESGGGEFHQELATHYMVLPLEAPEGGPPPKF
jgi:serine/threonine protein kinase